MRHHDDWTLHCTQAPPKLLDCRQSMGQGDSLRASFVCQLDSSDSGGGVIRLGSPMIWNVLSSSHRKVGGDVRLGPNELPIFSLPTRLSSSFLTAQQQQSL
jgi:hypothetical protein